MAKARGFSRRWVEAAQELYEAKLATYPRTDCPYLPMELRDKAESVMAAIGFEGHEAIDLTRTHVAWDTSKVEAHHGIIHTGQLSENSVLSQNARNVFSLICESYVRLFMAPEITDPGTTALQEDSLADIAASRATMADFMGGQIQTVRRLSETLNLGVNGMRAKNITKATLSGILLSGTTVEAQAAASNVLTGIQNMVQSSSAGWMSASLSLAQNLFVGLAGIEIAWTGIHWVLKKNDLSDFIASFALKMISILFFYMLLGLAPTWIPMIINSFAQAGQIVGASGGGGIPPVVTLDPSGVFEQGMTVSGAIWTAFGNASAAMGIGQTFAGALATLLGSVFAIIAYGLLALQILITNIESYIIIGGGALLLGFNGSKWTQVFAEKYLGYAVSVGIKLFVLYLIVGLGQNLATTWVTQLGTFTPETVIQVGAAALIYGAMGIMVPGLAGSMLNGSPSMSLGGMMGGAAAAAGGLAGGAMLGAGLATGGASNLGKLASLVASGGKDVAGVSNFGSGGAETLAKLGAQASSGSHSSSISGGGAPGGSGAPSTGNMDSLGSGTSAGAGSSSGQNPSLMQAGMESLGQSQDGIARHEGGSGGIQIRLGHSE
ncbi:MAG: P-type conjugative transfer protein TrbL [Ferrovum myxofaciens]|uniref:P-type conjugative transfer protein TrbL n=1 Tax=Ferrovum myxofaciens TaxID=416213 RepID=UPI002352F184|nr:P-type conjugative transfer protein TrbL [Ferrovum myxofaciens]QKE39949.1 MAG: P-type conjugative transfer protein TrbL [Ferrovum myxofaciens]